MINVNNNENSADFEDFNPQEQTSNPFMVSLISFLLIFILPFSLHFLPIVVIVIVTSLFGVVSGHRTHSRLKKNGSNRRGLTIVGLVLGYIAFGCSSLWSLLWISGLFSVI